MSFTRYPDYKDSGVEWLSSIPRLWGFKRINVIASLNDDVLPETTDGEQEITYVDIGSVSLSAGVEKFEVFTFKDAPSRARRKVKDGDVIISTVRTYLKAIAPIVNPPENLVVSTGFAVLRAKSDVKSSFTKYALQSDGFLDEIISRSTGVSYPAINASEIGFIKIPVPSLPEQTQIANFLDQETTKIDALVAEQKKIIELLKSKLDSLVLESFDNLDTKLIRIKNAVEVIERPVIQDDSQIYEPLGLFNRGRGLFHKEKRATADMGDSDFYWIKEGDLILSGQFAWEGSVALAYKEEEGCVVSHRYPVIRGKMNITLTEYLFALLTTDHGNFLLNQSSVGAAGRNRPLNINLLLKELIPVPNIKTQEKIAKIVVERRNLLREINEQTKLINERRSALISAAVTGQIDIRNYQPKEAV